MPLNTRAFAIAAGVLSGLFIFLLTVWLLLIGSGGETISLLQQVFLGYSFSFGGAVIGLLWGFVHGLIGGFIFASLYNGLASKGRFNASESAGRDSGEDAS